MPEKQEEKMIQSFDEIKTRLAGAESRTLAVAAAADAEVLRAVDAAVKAGWAKAILVGDVEKIKEIQAEEGLADQDYGYVQEAEPAEACRTAVRLVREGSAQVLMKGLVDTSVLLKAVLDKEQGLRKSPVLSHLALFRVPGREKLVFVTDAAMNISPDLEAKAAIVRNSVEVAQRLGLEEPIVAALCAVEKINPKMAATLDADALVQMNRSGELSGCRILGPLALDNAVSPEAARHKGIQDPDAGHADILLVPYIEVGNVLYKALVFFAGAENAGILLGAAAPIVLTSRADSDEAKLNSIALAMAVC
ncbi:MAG: bifunctional enoyl-CoA hydratase/phosphate acetyltransferase [Bacillota bacterium]|nr:bifunctional enoyl-CoA hydratase/phosphate acetyltransferase [Bacillota bacterium]